jgi:hypothetical protein
MGVGVSLIEDCGFRISDLRTKERKHCGMQIRWCGLDFNLTWITQKGADLQVSD